LRVALVDDGLVLDPGIVLAGAQRERDATVALLAADGLDAKDLDLHLVARLADVARTGASGPRDLALVDEPLEPLADVDEEAVLADLRDDAVEDGADLEVLEALAGGLAQLL